MTRWAILIGVDYYGGIQEDLRGCVNDVIAVKQHLEYGAEGKSTKTITLTAPLYQPSDEISELSQGEESSSWPTHKNIEKALKSVLDKAEPGHTVYIHYSGHGSRIVLHQLLNPPETSHRGQNLLLVLYNNMSRKKEYFHGVQLAYYLREMAKKGLPVTLVLDCCHSGSAMRTRIPSQKKVRGLDYEKEIDEYTPPELDCMLLPSMRDTRVRTQDFYLDADKYNSYTILTACGPNEQAAEEVIAEECSTQRRGVLTYYLLQLLGELRSRNVEATKDRVYEGLRLKFRASRPQQTPMLFGNRNHTFFGRIKALPVRIDHWVPIIRRGYRHVLDQGEVHGVLCGDQYDAYPPEIGWAERAEEIEGPGIRLEVGNVRFLDADLINVGSPVDVIQTGWKAKLVATVMQRRIPIRITAAAEERLGGLGAIKAREKTGRYEIIAAGDRRPCHYCVDINSQKDMFEVLDRCLQRIPSLPTISAVVSDTEEQIANVLWHIASYTFTERIANPSANEAFASSVQIDISSSSDGDSLVQSQHVVSHNRDWNLIIKNNSNWPIYVAALDLTLCWEIDNIFAGSGDESFQIIGAGDTIDWGIKATIPDSVLASGKSQCENMVKIFITTKLTIFPAAVLPPLLPTGTYQYSGQFDQEDQGLSVFIDQLAAEFRESRDGNNLWFVKDILMHISM